MTVFFCVCVCVCMCVVVVLGGNVNVWIFSSFFSVMAFVTYVLVAGVVMGTQNRFVLILFPANFKRPYKDS